MKTNPLDTRVYDLACFIAVMRADGTFEPDYSQYDIEYTMYSGVQPHFQQTISGKHSIDLILLSRIHDMYLYRSIKY